MMAPTVAIVIRKFSSKTFPLFILENAFNKTSFPTIIYATINTAKLTNFEYWKPSFEIMIAMI